MKFSVTTEWRDVEGAHFVRRHTHEARTEAAAKNEEAKHNRKRMDEGMREEGWQWRIVKVEQGNPLFSEEAGSLIVFGSAAVALVAVGYGLGALIDKMKA